MKHGAVADYIRTALERDRGSSWSSWSDRLGLVPHRDAAAPSPAAAQEPRDPAPRSEGEGVAVVTLVIRLNGRRLYARVSI